MARGSLGRVDGLADPHLRLAFRLLALTAARVSEVLRARWEDIDFISGLWRLPSPKAGIPQTIPLSPELLQDLTDCPRVGPFLIPGRNPEKARNDKLKGPWARLKAAANLPPGIHIHDIRRTVGYIIGGEARTPRRPEDPASLRYQNHRESLFPHGNRRSPPCAWEICFSTRPTAKRTNRSIETANLASNLPTFLRLAHGAVSLSAIDKALSAQNSKPF